MSASVLACRCGFLPCTADPVAAIEMLWDHIEKAHTATSGVRLMVGHQGAYVWRNAAELVWECDEDCPHPTHEEQP